MTEQSQHDQPLVQPDAPQAQAATAKPGFHALALERLRLWLNLGSLRARLLIFLLAAIALAGVLQGVLAYRTTLAETDALLDYHMQQTALALRSGLPVDAHGVGRTTAGPDEHYEFVVQVWSKEGLRIFESAVGADLPQLAVLGFSNVSAPGGTYRVFSLQTSAQVIQVAQNLRVRQGMASAMALRTMLPIGLIAPLLALAVWWVVGRSLAPIEKVRGQLAQRQAGDLSPVSDAQLPDEVQPLVKELNLLLARVQQAFEAQQSFVADAAHELRSPLAALKLQVQGLQRARDDEGRALAVQRLGSGIDRATQLVEQLLLLARNEAGRSPATPAQAVAMDEVLRWALADTAAQAQARQIDLGLEAVPDVNSCLVRGEPEALRTLVRNLLDNAIKYTPAGGRVDVALQIESSSGLLLTVEDSGPGIAPAERQRVWDRFYRAHAASSAAQQATGSGLGLAIVEAIARQHGVTLDLDSSPGLGGLRVSVRLPLPAKAGSVASV